MKRTSQISAERVKQTRQNRFNPIRGLTAEKLANALDEFRAGNVRPAALIWDTLLNRNGTLKTVSSKRYKDASSRPYEILKLDETERAQQHAAALTYFYNNISVTSAHEPDERGGFALLRRQMLSALGMKRAVHEIVLKPRRANGQVLPLNEDGGTFKPETLLSAELRFCPLFWFEMRTGPLAYLASDWDYYGQPMKPGDWLVTCGDGLMESCSVEYIFMALARKDLLGFSDKFGTPAVDIEVNAKPGDPEWEEAKQMAADFGNNLSLVRTVGGKVTLLETGKSASTLPQPLLIEDAKREMIIIWQGGDLGTLSSKDGQGTGATQQSKSSDVLTAGDCELLTDTLNQQLDRLVIDYLFGEEPLAYVKIIPPKELNVAVDRETAGFLADRGVEVGVAQLRERLGWAAPEEGEPLLEKSAAPNPNLNLNPDLNPALANEDTRRAAVVESFAADLQPVRAELAAILQIEDAALKEVKLRAFLDRIEQLKRDLPVASQTQRTLAQLIGGDLASALARKPAALENYDSGQLRDSLGQWVDENGGGLSVSANIARGGNAIDRAVRNKTDVQKAMYRKEVGQIDFEYGRPGTSKPNANGVTHADGYGISHIVAKHGEATARQLPELLAKGKISPHEESNRRYVRHEGAQAVLEQRNTKKAFVITSFEPGKA